MEKIEQIFNFIDKSAEKHEQSDSTYLDGVLATLSGILDGKDSLPVGSATKEEMRKAIQLAILKGMRLSSQPHHQMTPDSLGLFIAYLVEQLLEDKLEKGMISILDPAMGTGNLLFTIMNQLDGKVSATGIEIDDLLIQLARETAELIEQPIDLYHQDALRPLFVEPVDLVVCDLPVGYYPNEEVAKGYELHAKDGMSYAHHLYIEQSLKYTKEGGYLIFLIPATLFESDQAEALHAFLKKHAWILAVMQLPENMFKSKQHEKSVFILQKKSEKMRPPKEVLLAKVPNMSNRHAMSLFFEKIKMWKEQK
ncbi:class I SAM-dependent methyltransferase [Ureibacillus sp. FSL K6-8385]|uniref:Class I SAM-dependent methyltransferase n=1 Tax=Ureibacillus terrenus TaxID=118246 RepID=A0A540V1W7_9BACL|nr:class I SAM-dependent methyltransferase [Ureibacillus terrenus]MED3662549.1 class I SAM-dependent methyltransferase [Ureibacillus terrenus]MED3764803.1 class I SAM-dependent methyltransferase [Ureibacillus terrenus]TQE90213.1 class I SAM-dependent methyltransferase [Ureibacillus terrenus]